MGAFSFFSFSSFFYCSICFLLLASDANALGNETDRLALLSIKSQITLDPQNVTSSWNQTNPFCEWEGVTCSRRHTRVTVLNLRSKGLKGPISPSVGNLSFLRLLDLGNNSFNGDVPQELGRLFRLEIIFLSNNSLQGEIPANISLCSNLKSLSLSRNSFTGNIPWQLGSLSKLIVFSLGGNMLTGGIPPSFGNLTSLRDLQLPENYELGGSIPSTLSQLKNLKILSITSCNLSGVFPTALFNLSALEIISLSINQLTGKLPNAVGNTLSSLTRFLIAGNNFWGSIPGSLLNASRLQMLDIGQNQFTGKVPLHLGNLKGLTHLSMQRNRLGTGELSDLDFFPSLVNCSKLQVISLSFNNFGGVLPSSIGNFSIMITNFYLNDNQVSSKIPAEIGSLQNVIILSLRNNLFTGSIPQSIGTLQKLQALSIRSNKLSGNIPSSMRNMSSLSALQLSNNLLSGSVASVLGNQNMKYLELSFNNFSGNIHTQNIGLSSYITDILISHNSLTGSLPLEVGSLRYLEQLDASENQLSGDIPPILGSSLSLRYLNFQSNFFHGILPSSLGSLEGLQVLDVSRNNLSGKIPSELDELQGLQTLNLSYNNFEGELPTKGVFQNVTAFSVVGNQKICGGIPELELPKCHITKPKRQVISLAMKLVISLSIAFVVLGLGLIMYLRAKKSKSRQHSSEIQEDLRRVSYNDLSKATDGFSSANLIGMGSYGSVYKGTLPPDDYHVAVKVLNLMEHGALKSFMAECETLRQVRHRNLLKIITACSSVDFRGNDFKALVFEFMNSGSLETWLHPSSDGQSLPRRLSLSQRINISIDVASALDYLHNRCERAIVHCDLKPSNILLDNDLTAHVGDFGLAKFLSKSSNDPSKNKTNSSVVRGTIGYIPPEYGMGHEVTSQGDVYSYGILLLEMFTGKRPTDKMFNEGLSLHDFTKMAVLEGKPDVIDMYLVAQETYTKVVSNQFRESCVAMLRIGIACSVELMAERMEIKDVLSKLYSIKDALQDDTLLM